MKSIKLLISSFIQWFFNKFFYSKVIQDSLLKELNIEQQKLLTQIEELTAEKEYLELEAKGDERVKLHIAELLGLSDEPRWKWILLEVQNLIIENKKSKLDLDERIKERISAEVTCIIRVSEKEHGEPPKVISYNVLEPGEYNLAIIK